MDTWKPIRLWICLGVMLALFAAGVYGRLNPRPPYRYPSNDIKDWTDEDIRQFFQIDPMTGPFRRLELDFERREYDLQLKRNVRLRDSF